MVRLLFHSDDFGKTREVNAAILQAHTEGVLSSGSLMVTGEAFKEAVDLAKSHPRLKVGLHLALSQARPVLPPEKIPALVTPDGCFPADPAVAGMRLACCAQARTQATAEITAQFEAFSATGLPFAHVDGHHHLHMHPFLFGQCLHHAQRLGIPRIRVVREFGNPLPPRRDRQGFASKLARHFTFLALAWAADRRLLGTSIQKLNGVLGLWETGRMSEAYLLRAIPKIPSGDWEVYAHIGSEGCDEELHAFLSPVIRARLNDLKIQLL